ncbi:MAG: hypothetical protein JWO24_1400 [Rhodospirillales bacterium]|nr:hypothetical protein [Rhodospirillales bacterium]
MDEGLVELATQLWAARRDRLTIDGTRFRLPVSTDEAYAVQHHIVSLSGSTSCGYKIGSTSKEAQAFLGTTGPSAGALLRPFLFESRRSWRSRQIIHRRSKGSSLSVLAGSFSLGKPHTQRTKSRQRSSASLARSKSSVRGLLAGWVAKGGCLQRRMAARMLHWWSGLGTRGAIRICGAMA